MADMPVYDAKRGGERPLGYGDIAILLRATTQAQTFAETLALCGIPCYAQSSGGYFDSIEVMVLLNVLRVIDNRRQDIPLLSVLRSPLFGYSEEALLKLRLRAGRDVPFYEAFFSLAASEDAKDADDPLAGQVRETAAALDRFREIERLYGVTALLAALLDETGYYERMGALKPFSSRTPPIFRADSGSGTWTRCSPVRRLLSRRARGACRAFSRRWIMRRATRVSALRRTLRGMCAASRASTNQRGLNTRSYSWRRWASASGWTTGGSRCFCTTRSASDFGSETAYAAKTRRHIGRSFAQNGSRGCRRRCAFCTLR